MIIVPIIGIFWVPAECQAPAKPDHVLSDDCSLRPVILYHHDVRCRWGCLEKWQDSEITSPPSTIVRTQIQTPLNQNLWCLVSFSSSSLAGLHVLNPECDSYRANLTFAKAPNIDKGKRVARRPAWRSTRRPRSSFASEATWVFFLAFLTYSWHLRCVRVLSPPAHPPGFFHTFFSHFDSLHILLI